jgi:hypothetical protein
LIFRTQDSFSSSSINNKATRKTDSSSNSNKFNKTKIIRAAITKHKYHKIMCKNNNSNKSNKKLSLKRKITLLV